MLDGATLWECGIISVLLASVSDYALHCNCFFRRHESSSLILTSNLERFLTSLRDTGGCNKLEAFVTFVLHDLELFMSVRRGYC